MQSNGSVYRLASWKGSCHDALFHSCKSLPINPALLSNRVDCHCGSGKTREAQCAGAPTRVVIAYPSPTPRVAPLWLAQDLDFFGKYNLAAQIGAGAQ